MGLIPCMYLNINELYTCVGLKPKIPKELQLLYNGTENFEHFRFQSI